VLFMHRFFDAPIGKTLSAEIREDGLWVRVKILATDLGKDIILLIKEGVIRSFSIGYQERKVEENSETKTRRILDLRLMEISVVNLGANFGAVFSEAKSKGLSLKHLQPSEFSETSRKGNLVDHEVRDAIKRTEETVGGFRSSLETVSGDVQRLGKNLNDQGALLRQVQEKADALSKGAITPAEFKAFTEKVGAVILKLEESINSAKGAENVRKVRYAVKDWRGMADIPWLRKDDGSPLSAMEQKAYRLFQAPVNFEDSEDGHLLKMTRDLHDVVAVVDAYMRGKKTPGYAIQRLKSFQDLKKLVGYFDSEFAEKAMFSTGVGLGDEWVPIFQSGNLIEFLRLEPGLFNRIPAFDMPSQPYDWPLLIGGATTYRGFEAAVNNPTQATASNLSTAKVTLSAEPFITRIPCSPDMVEDSVVSIFEEIRKEIVRSQAEAYDASILNGDTTATHRDTGRSYTAVNVESAFMGLRYLAIDTAGSSFDTASTTAGVGDATTAFVAKDVRYLRKLMGVAGADPSKVLYVCNLDTWFQALNFSEVTKANEFGNPSTWLSGVLPGLDGVEIFITSKISNTLNGSGVDAGGTKTGILALRPSSFKWASRRGLTVEFEKDLLAQQWNFVATSRKQLKKLAAAADRVVAYGFNITP